MFAAGEQITAHLILAALMYRSSVSCSSAYSSLVGHSGVSSV